MRKNLLGAGATLAFAIASCGGSSTATTSPTASCAKASAAHHAWIVVEHLDGKSVQKCVGFDGATIDGKTLMDESGIVVKTQTFSFGLGVCSVDNEPKTFTECFPKNAPYWSLWTESNGTWTSAQTGFDAVKLNDKDALGWHFVQPTDPSPAPPPLAKES